MISLILCSYRPGGFDVFVRSFAGMKGNEDYEVIVVDDCPGRVERNTVPAYLQAHGVKLAWYGPSKPKHRPETKGGLCNAYNTALAHVRGSLTLWVSDYTIMQPGWYEQWMAMIAKHEPRTLISGSAIVFHCPQPTGFTDTETAIDWAAVTPKWPWVPKVFETFHFAAPTAFFEAINGVDERADHCHCWPVSSKVAQAKILGYELAVESEITSFMLDHRTWFPTEKAPVGCGGEGMWKITHAQSIPAEPQWEVPSPNLFDLKAIRYGPSPSFAEFVHYDFPLEHDAIFRELLAYDVQCQRSCQFDRDPVGAYKLKVPLSPLHWSRQMEWPWTVLNAKLTGTETCLDVGGGWACVKYAIAKRCSHLTCLDNMEEAIDASRRTTNQLGFSNIDFYNGDARGLPYADNSFDRVFCLSVLEHIPGDHLLCVQELLRVLKPGGTALITMDLLIEGENKDNFFVTVNDATQILHLLGIPRPRNDCRNGADLDGMKLTVLMACYHKPEAR